MVSGWTGQTACALQKAMGLSNEAFAKRLGIGVRTVAGWHKKPTLRPQSAMQEILDTALEQASRAVKARFGQHGDAPTPAADLTEAQRRFAADPGIIAALDWLDRHTSWEPGTARREVAALLAKIDLRRLHDRGTRRGDVNQRRLAEALGEYYDDRPDGHGLYTVGEAVTSVLTCADWLDLGCVLMPPADRLTVTGLVTDTDVELDDATAARAVQRLAETLALNVRLTAVPLYRLLDINPQKGAITGTAEVTPMAGFALTMDLLEGEFTDAIAAGEPTSPGTLPLRDRYLSDVSAVLNPDLSCG